MKLINHKSFTTLELIVVLALLGVGGGFFGSMKIPFVKTKADVQKELTTEKESHQLTKDELASANRLTAEQKTLLEDFKKGAQQQAVLDQSAANSLARITATFELLPVANRKETVINYAAQEAAKALPAPVNYPEILKATRDQLDEAKTSNAQLLAQHTSDLTLIDTQKQALAAAQKAIQLQQEKVDAQQAANDAQKVALEQKRKDLEVKESVLGALTDSLNHLKYGLMGLVGLVGVICCGAGYFLRSPLLFAKGIVLVILAGLGMLIPITWYLALVGVVMLAAIGYVVSQWHKEKSVADNAVGILGEVKQKAPEFWAETVKPIAQTYWGTTVKDVAKADAWVDKKLYDMNMLSKDKQP